MTSPVEPPFGAAGLSTGPMAPGPVNAGPSTPTGVRRHTHPVTPVVTAGRVAPFILIAMFAWGPDGGAFVLLAALAAGVVIALLICAYSYF